MCDIFAWIMIQILWLLLMATDIFVCLKARLACNRANKQKINCHDGCISNFSAKYLWLLKLLSINKY